MAHGYCYAWNAPLLWTHVSSDIITGLAYYFIASVLVYFIFKKKKDVPYHWVFLLFGAFIFFCGSTHFLNAWTVFSPIYWASASVKAINAIISLATAIALIPLFPKLLALPSLKKYLDKNIQLSNQLEDQVTDLKYEIKRREEAEESLLESEKKYHIWLDNSPVCTNIVDIDFNLQFMSAAGVKQLKIDDITEYYGKPYPLSFYPDSFRIPMTKNLKKAKDTGETIIQEASVVDVGGNVLWYHSTIVPIKDDRGLIDYFEVISAEITDRMQAEGSVKKLSQAIEQAGESVIITDSEGTIEYVNKSFTRMTGYESEEVLGENPRILQSGNQDAAFYENMWSTITNKKVWHSSIIDKRKDGSFYPAMMSIAPILNEVGEITHYVGFQQDMSEYETLKEQFLQAQKMESLGTLVGGIAHDFNNMLAGITGNLYLAKKRTSEMPDVMEKLDNIEKVSFRAADMIQQLLSFARKSRVEIKPFPLTPFIKETFKLLRSSIPENITIHQNIGIDPLQINGDSTQLHQVLMNLVNNACDALEGADSPCITIKLDAFHADEKFIEVHPDINVGRYAHLSVEDNGEGIPESKIKHLFEPFFTTKEQGKGTGLGLAMVFGAVQTHEGAIDVESVAGEGTTFHIYIPLLKPTEVEAAPMGQEVIEGRGELILLVDDQESIINMEEEVLASFGYKVLTATNGQQAIEVYKTHADEIDLIIMDVVMPIMGGSQAAQNIRQINPQVKIIFSTGYDKDTQSNLVNETVITKPFPIVKMSHMIRQQLDL